MLIACVLSEFFWWRIICILAVVMVDYRRECATLVLFISNLEKMHSLSSNIRLVLFDLVVSIGKCSRFTIMCALHILAVVAHLLMQLT